jgi:PTS system mannose-specific IID component
METAGKKLTRSDLLRSFWRYLFMNQCGWNYERMQSVGYCYAMLPILQKTRPDPEDFKEALRWKRLARRWRPLRV